MGCTQPSSPLCLYHLFSSPKPTISTQNAPGSFSLDWHQMQDVLQNSRKSFWWLLNKHSSDWHEERVCTISNAKTRTRKAYCIPTTIHRYESYIACHSTDSYSAPSQARRVAMEFPFLYSCLYISTLGYKRKGSKWTELNKEWKSECEETGPCLPWPLWRWTPVLLCLLKALNQSLLGQEDDCGLLQQILHQADRTDHTDLQAWTFIFNDVIVVTIWVLAGSLT